MGEKKGFFKRLVEGLTKTRDNIVSGIDSILMDFQTSTMTFMKNSKRFLLWEIWASMRQWKLLRI